MAKVIHIKSKDPPESELSYLKDQAPTESQLKEGKYLLLHLMIEQFGFTRKWFLTFVFFALGSQQATWSASITRLYSRNILCCAPLITTMVTPP